MRSEENLLQQLKQTKQAYWQHCPKITWSNTVAEKAQHNVTFYAKQHMKRNLSAVETITKNVTCPTLSDRSGVTR